MRYDCLHFLIEHMAVNVNVVKDYVKRLRYPVYECTICDENGGSSESDENPINTSNPSDR